MKKFFYILITLLSIKESTAYLVEMEIYSSKKTCVSELFNEGEPISVRARVTESPEPRYSIYITIENDSKILLAHKKYEKTENSTILTYNNDKTQTLKVCIDNFESFDMVIELEIKFAHHLANTDSAPSLFEYNELNVKLQEVESKMENSYTYFVQNEEYTDKMVGRGNSFEYSLVLVSLVTIFVSIGVGMLQIVLIRRDIIKKKRW